MVFKMALQTDSGRIVDFNVVPKNYKQLLRQRGRPVSISWCIKQNAAASENVPLYEVPQGMIFFLRSIEVTGNSGASSVLSCYDEHDASVNASLYDDIKFFYPILASSASYGRKEFIHMIPFFTGLQFEKDSMTNDKTYLFHIEGLLLDV